MTNGLQIKKC